jgi:large subunit ribosomal protein L1
MIGRGKKYNAVLAKIDKTKRYAVDEAIKLVVESKFTKFNETIDCAINLGVDPKQGEQLVRGTCILPHGLGKPVKVLVFAKGEKEKEAQTAQADYIGNDDLIEKISKGWMDFDKAVATPDMMGAVGKIGRILGPRGLMPNPKLGTVTFDVARAVSELKKGKIEFKVDKAGIVHASIAKTSFELNKIKENFLSLIETIIKLKPPTSKGTYLKNITLSSTMGVGIKVDINDIRSNLK